MIHGQHPQKKLNRKPTQTQRHESPVASPVVSSVGPQIPCPPDSKGDPLLLVLPSVVGPVAVVLLVVEAHHLAGAPRNTPFASFCCFFSLHHPIFWRGIHVQITQPSIDRAPGRHAFGLLFRPKWTWCSQHWASMAWRRAKSCPNIFKEYLKLLPKIFD